MRNILDLIGWDFTEFRNRFQGCCPIHGGDNPTAAAIFKDNGVWQCFTHGCHNEVGPLFPHFIKAYIQKYDGSIVNVDEINKWLEDNKDNFNGVSQEIKKIKEQKIICTREHVLSSLDIPSKYYLNRGFSKEILERHDVGLSKKPGLMYNRNVIPIYNHFFTGVIGCSGRLDTEVKADRWRHSKNFPRDASVYNSWFAESYVKSSGKIYLTEGPAKVWKMEEAGFLNSVAIMGTAFTLTQKKVLSRMGPEQVIVIMDNDAAGQEAAQKIKDELSELYKVKVLKCPFKDLDETDVKEVQDFVGSN